MLFAFLFDEATKPEPNTLPLRIGAAIGCVIIVAIIILRRKKKKKVQADDEF